MHGVKEINIFYSVWDNVHSCLCCSVGLAPIGHNLDFLFLNTFVPVFLKTILITTVMPWAIR